MEGGVRSGGGVRSARGCRVLCRSSRLGRGAALARIIALNESNDPPRRRRCSNLRKERSATSSSEYFANFMASGMHRCGASLTTLTSFLNLAGSIDQTILMLVMIYILWVGIISTWRDNIPSSDIPMLRFCSIFALMLALSMHVAHLMVGFRWAYDISMKSEGRDGDK